MGNPTARMTEARIKRALADFWKRVEAVNAWGHREGWGIFNGSEIQRIDSPDDGSDPKFECDEDALHHVQRLSTTSALHKEALTLLTIAKDLEP